MISAKDQVSKLNERSAKHVRFERKQRGKEANAQKNSGQGLSNNATKLKEQTGTPGKPMCPTGEAHKNAEGKSNAHKKRQEEGWSVAKTEQTAAKST